MLCCYQNVKELGKLLDNIYISNIKLNVNIPKHLKWRRTVEQGPQRHYKEINNKANHKGKGNSGNNYRDGEQVPKQLGSYAQTLTGVVVRNQ